MSNGSVVCYSVMYSRPTKINLTNAKLECIFADYGTEQNKAKPEQSENHKR